MNRDEYPNYITQMILYKKNTGIINQLIPVEVTTMTIENLKERLAITKNEAEKAELLGKIMRLEKENKKEESTKKEVIPVRDALPVADHKAPTRRARGMVFDDRAIL